MKRMSSCFYRQDLRILLTGKLPFAISSSPATGIRRSVVLGGTGLAGGITTSSYNCFRVRQDQYSRFWEHTSFICLVVPRGSMYLDPYCDTTLFCEILLEV